jgi:hypothetical protein
MTGAPPIPAAVSGRVRARSKSVNLSYLYVNFHTSSTSLSPTIEENEELEGDSERDRVQKKVCQAQSLPFELFESHFPLLLLTCLLFKSETLLYSYF